MASFSHTCGKTSRGSDSDSDDEISAAIARVKRREIEDSLMEKDDLRVTAVECNDVGALAKLSALIEWYKYIEPDNGDTLLHVAVKRRNKEVFDYLLAIADVPVNCKNKQGDTALKICFSRWVSAKPIYEYFTYELIRKGASVDSIALEPGDTPLHLAISKGYVTVSQLLMNMGCDLDAWDNQERAPFWKCFNYIIERRYARPALIEILSALLYHGADPNSPTGSTSWHDVFRTVVDYLPSNAHLLKLILDFSVDKYTPIRFKIILKLADMRSPVFRDTAERAENVIECDCADSMHLFMMDADDLDLLIKKFPDAIRELFAGVECLNIYGPFGMKKLVENANMLLESGLRDDTVDFMRRHGCRLIDRTQFKEDESVTLSHICFLVSFGVQLNERDLLRFYETYGYGESLKILLHMEIETGLRSWMRWSPFGLLLYDVNCDLEQILDNSEKYSPQDVEQLIYYFSDARLRALCDGSESAEVAAAIQNQPAVPLLSELARNVFRRHLVEIFNVTKTNQFYKLVNGLPIPPAHKKIITFETKLY